MREYPWRGQFTSRDQVAEYFARDRIVCLTCGHPFKMLSRHLVAKHGTNAVDYKLLYGIPQTRGLSGLATRITRSQKAKQQFIDAPCPAWAPPGGKNIEGRQEHPQWSKDEARARVSGLLKPVAAREMIQADLIGGTAMAKEAFSSRETASSPKPILAPSPSKEPPTPDKHDGSMRVIGSHRSEGNLT